MQTKRTRHAVDNITYHPVWCPKRRRPVLTDEVAQRRDEMIREQVKVLQSKGVALEIQRDHVHLSAEFAPTLAVRPIMHRLKGHTSHELRNEVEGLHRCLPSLWTRSCYVGMGGNVSAETIRSDTEARSGQ
jgi:putative transposase